MWTWCQYIRRWRSISTTICPVSKKGRTHVRLLSFSRRRLSWTGEGSYRRSCTWACPTEELASWWLECPIVDSGKGHTHGCRMEERIRDAKEVARSSCCCHCHSTCNWHAIDVGVRESWWSMVHAFFRMPFTYALIGFVCCLCEWAIQGYKYCTFVLPGLCLAFLRGFHRT